MRTYDFVRDNDGKQGIRCRICRLTSWNPGDVANLYCGAHHAFHAELFTPNPCWLNALALLNAGLMSRLSDHPDTQPYVELLMTEAGPEDLIRRLSEQPWAHAQTHPLQ